MTSPWWVMTEYSAENGWKFNAGSHRMMTVNELRELMRALRIISVLPDNDQPEAQAPGLGASGLSNADGVGNAGEPE